MNKYLLSVLLGTLVVVCICGCGKNTAQFISSADFSEEKETAYISESEEFGSIKKETETQMLCIYVCGAVHHPGVYELLEGSRVCDAFLAAGGLTDEAAEDYWNQARILSDGEMIYVPTKEEAKERVPETAVNPKNDETSDKININTATKESLMTLPGIGEAKAERIIAYRNEHGAFSSIEEIMEVEGIKEGMYEKIKDYIVI